MVLESFAGRNAVPISSHPPLYQKDQQMITYRMIRVIIAAFGCLCESLGPIYQTVSWMHCVYGVSIIYFSSVILYLDTLYN